jgi:uncharacterized protein (DUF2237 family)
MANAKNVLGKPLALCCGNTGFTREGFCYVPQGDMGNHSVCAIMSDEFLSFSKSKGNDLSTAMPQYQFPGLVAGDKWCLCANRWQEALIEGCAPKVLLSATNERCLSMIKLTDLQDHAVLQKSQKN